MAFYKLDSILFSLSCAVSDAEVFICHVLQGITPESVLEEQREKADEAVGKSNGMCKEIDGKKLDIDSSEAISRKHSDKTAIKIPGFFKM